MVCWGWGEALPPPGSEISLLLLHIFGVTRALEGLHHTLTLTHTYTHSRTQKRWMAEDPQKVDSIAPWQQLVAGGIGGIATWVVSYPMDVIKSRIQTDSSYRGIWHCAATSYKAEGMSVFFKGLETTIVRAFPVNAIIFITYEVLMKVFYMF